MTRIRTLNFLPEIFQTPTNAQFLGATLDQLVNPPVAKQIEGYIGSKFGYGINAKDYYVTEPTKTRTDYQLDPGVIFTKNNESVAKDFISYPGILDALKLSGGVVDNNNRLFNSEFYSWDSFSNLDKIINFNQYYWLPEGPPAVTVASATVFSSNDYVVVDLANGYNISALGSGAGTTNPTITLLRGGNYNFIVDQNTNFWIQTEPGTSGKSLVKPNQTTRDVFGVTNNGATQGIVSFSVPNKNAQDEYILPGNNLVDIVSNKPFAEINGQLLSGIDGIDGITSLNGLTVMFYNTGVVGEVGYTSSYYSESPFDTNEGVVSPKTITVTATSAIGSLITCNSTANLNINDTITFTGTSFGGIEAYNAGSPTIVSAGSFVISNQYYINDVGTTDWISIGVTNSADVTASISGTSLIVTTVNSGNLSIGQTITGAGVSSGTKIIGYDEEASLLSGNDTYTVSISQTVASTNIYGYDIISGKLFTATGIGTGTGSAVSYDPTLYYVQSIAGATQFTISDTIGGSPITLTNDTGSLIGSINQGLFEEGYYSTVADNFYTIEYVGNVNNPVLRLVPTSSIPINQKITAQYGTQFIGLEFYKNVLGNISLIPIITAPLNTLYYQDGSSANKVGIIKIIENNVNNTLNVETDILGKTNFTSTNGITFTNGLKVQFDGDVIPLNYLQGEYYVEGVGTSIELIPTTDLICPESFTRNTFAPYDMAPYDIGNYDNSLFIPVTPDYITIARNSLSSNPWSRSNRWFHVDVINATASYNNDPNIVINLATSENKAKRPIIEFYPNLKLFHFGTNGLAPVDFIDFRTTDALNYVAGQQQYYPDVQIYTDYSATIAGTNTTPVSISSFQVDDTIIISSSGTTAQAVWNYLADTIGVAYIPGNRILVKNDPASYVGSLGTGTGIILSTSTTITIDADKVFTGGHGDTQNTVFEVGQYVSDLPNPYDNLGVPQSLTPSLPLNTVISSITGTTTLTITVTWDDPTIIVPNTNCSLVANDINNSNYIMPPNSRIIFAEDENINVRNKIFVVNYSETTSGSRPVITLTVAPDGNAEINDSVVITRGYAEQGLSHFYDGLYWEESQQKLDVNQPPLFDIFDDNGISFGDKEIYLGTSFKGNKLFAYGIGSGARDNVLGFPIRYTYISNVGDISFDVSINSDSFNYVTGTRPITQKVNTGYVYNYTSKTNYNRLIGWQTALAPSIQYQIFEFNYNVGDSTAFVCDVSLIPSSQSQWPTLQVYNNNVLQNNDSYVVTVGPNSTTINLNLDTSIDTKIQILILSNQVSSQGYYQVPINLSNNPFNTDITTANIGDIRGQYQSIFTNNPNMTGIMFGANNYRDLGNVVPYGNRIIQNSASLVLPSVFLRQQNHNLFDALMFNSREYIKFKTLLVDTVNNSDYVQRFDASYMLDDALDQISSTKNQEQSFFWSDMLPSKAPYVTNTYKFANNLDTSVYPLTKVYNFDTANYNGVLVYLIRTVNNITVTRQLIKGVDYTVSNNSPSLTITLDLLNGDQIIIKEYNQTYGSYVPNTPTKLGLYPSTIPSVILDSNYNQPTYFIKGHDGSYNKLYGNYDPVNNILTDFRDQVLLEFETRVYNNLKLGNEISINSYEILPGFFRDSDYSYEEWLYMYSTSFLNWIGQNRLNFKQQVYLANNEFTYNYRANGNRLDKTPLEMGYWRGIYQYFYDSYNPDTAPWELLGFTNQPTWWTDRYGPAPYTSDNTILWNDLAEGINWNNGDPVVIPQAVRPGLLNIIPVDQNGDLKSPLITVIGNYNPNSFKKDWIVGDIGPVELSYRRSSTYPFDLMRLFALTKPAKFFNLGVDVDNYKYNEEFDQYLVNNRSHLIPSNIEIYGNGTAKTSYINWIVDYEKQLGIDATTNIKDLLSNLDVRLVYRLAGYSDKTQLDFYVEKLTPNSVNSSLLIPEESYSILLYENQPYDRLIYSGVIVQITNNGYTIYGNSQVNPYFTVLKPSYNGKYDNINVETLKVKVAVDHTDKEELVPYGTMFYSVQEVSQFLLNYGAYLKNRGMIFETLENALEVNWTQMVAEFLYWAQLGFEVGSVITLNPAANNLKIDKESQVVQPLTIKNTNFILNQNLYPIQSSDLCVERYETAFEAKPLNAGDSLAYAQFNLSNFEHGIVFDNVTLFDDLIYNLVTGLKQNRIYLRGSKSAEWNGTITASGFIYNQDNITEWKKEYKYTTGSIVKYKNKYWTALKIIQPSNIFNERDWKETDYNEIQKGLLPNSSTRSYESTLYYDTNKANLEKDADLLGFSLIGYRPRDYLAIADLTDITQINIYKNILKNKGTRNAFNAFKGLNLPQGGIDYEVYENWAIKSGQFGGVLNDNFVQFKLNQSKLTANPSIVSLTNGIYTPGSQQEVPLYSLYNYGQPINTPNILPTVNSSTPSTLLPTAGYVNFNDVKMSAYFYSQLPLAVNKEGIIVNIDDFYVRDYVWIADYLAEWQVYTPESIGQVISVRNNLNNTATVTFAEDHNLSRYQIFAIINFDSAVNSYYIATNIVNPKQVIINLTLNQNTRILTGNGIGLRFQSQRVDSPADIINLPLTTSEFRKNTVWVDENTDGNWAVLRKSLNYQYEEEFTKTNTLTFGSSVAYTPQAGYLIGDKDAGIVYRYTYNDLSKTYNLNETLTQTASFGSAISHKQNIYVISQPTGTPRVYIYTINNSQESDDFLLYQPAIAAPGGVTDWGSTIALSDDTNWLYISDVDNNKVYVYRKQNINLSAGYFVIGETYQITDLGDTDFTAIGAIENKVGIYFVATGIGTGTGTAIQCTYKESTEIDASGFLTAGDQFGKSIATDYHGDTVVVGAPYLDYDPVTENWGSSYIYQRSVQNIEVQYNSISNNPQIFPLAWTPTTVAKTVTKTLAGNLIRLNNVTNITVNDPIIFTGTGLTGTDILTNFVYYINSISGNDITIKLSRSSTTAIIIQAVDPISGVTATVQTDPLYVSVNGLLVDDSNYAVVGSTFYYTTSIQAGDIINVSDNKFTLIQTVNITQNPRIGVQFGTSVDITRQASEILVGSPFALNTINQEGAVYRYTNGGGKYGQIIGTTDTNITTPRKLLINGFYVELPIGNATIAANTINEYRINNVSASAINGKLAIQVIDSNLTQYNEKLMISVVDTNTLAELGFDIYTQTQIIQCPHSAGPTQFGTTVKFNERDSFVVSAPVGTRFAATTFDFIDDELDNDTIFDNNSTQFTDSYPNAGAVYMFDYLGKYNESLSNTGNFVYAQSVNAQNQIYGAQPKYGTALEFIDNRVMIGTPNFRPEVTDGQVITYINELGIKDWSEYRRSSAIVDSDRVKNFQIFSAETNDTLINLDFMDPLQGKLLGAVRQNIDVISNNDPASYNLQTQRNLTWGPEKVGSIWFDTSNVRFVNYHQNDIVYNSKYWGTLFPGSDVAVYTWVASNVTPVNYQGPGIPYDVNFYVAQATLNASNDAVPVYYFWVRNTNIIFTKRGKTLSDTVIAEYINNPKNSGISYLATLLPNSVALYNSNEYITDNDSVLQLGYSIGTNDDPSHTEYTLIKSNFADDFLPGLPNLTTPVPNSLYDRLLDSMSGVDEEGGIVPNPYLPKAVQSGVLARPRQSFFFDRYEALKNYLTFANEVLKQYPITEIRTTTYLFTEGENFNTRDYWEYINWWAVGYDNNTKSVLQVPLYADLSTLNVNVNTIVTVEMNGVGKKEVYRYDGDGIWTRIGLENGTIELKTYLWDYAEAKLGFGDNFFDTSVYDLYPSEETRWIIRALNEQIYINELQIYRNKSLILLFEYIQSETTESQNFLPWLNKTSLVDVSHKVRELLPYEVYQSDNQDFLEGYLNEVKPYHVVIKEFVLTYIGNEIYQGSFTDFDLPAKFNTSVQKFVSPQLVYSNPTPPYQYLNTDNIWTNEDYVNWKDNYGISITGQSNYQITSLESYVTLASNNLIVKNSSGFPINGVIRIGEELIAYSSVDRVYNILSGLIRGFNNTTVSDHIPGELIYMDLPPVLLLDGGRGYINPPKVTAFIDETLYPPPSREAVLEAVMSLDSVLQINVIDPGQGYAVLPQIVIEPSLVVPFVNTNINLLTNTITLYAPLLQTGDIVRYRALDGSVEGLSDGQWYYINLLETAPISIIALYSSIEDVVNDHNRIVFYGVTQGNFTLELGAKASVISTSYPIRENNIVLRYDRTTYNSQVIDWEAGAYYGAFFAGNYNNSQDISSSSIQLESTQPPIESIYASAQGVVFEITDVSNDREVKWSGFERNVLSTDASNDVITLNVTSPIENASGSTIGFTVGMPVKFIGDVTGTGIINEQIYYIAQVVSLTEFKIKDENNILVSLGTATIGSAGLKCYTADVTDTAVLTVNYPGLRQVTATSSTTNYINVPISSIGTGGTSGFYVDLPIFFVGNVFGGIVENQVYYVTTVVDNQKFTISETKDPNIYELTQVNGASDYVLLDSTVGLFINEPLIFNTFQIAGLDINQLTNSLVDAGNFVIGVTYKIESVGTTDFTLIGAASNAIGVQFTATGSGTGTGSAYVVNNFGNIESGKVYYVSEIVNTTTIKISESINGTVFNPGTVAAAANTEGLITSQKDTLQLTTASGSMTMNVSLPVSPGQVNGQQFTMYNTSVQYPDINTGNIANLITHNIEATVSVVDIIALADGTEGMYVNMPIQVANNIGGLTTATTYYITNIDTIDITGTGTTAANLVLTSDTSTMYQNMPIVFTGSGVGGIIIGDTYYAGSIIANTSFKLSTQPDWPVGTNEVDLTAATAAITATGPQYIQVSTNPPGGVQPIVALSNASGEVEITQDIQTVPSFDVSYILGGYRVIMSDPGLGMAVNNTIAIEGNLIGGSTPANDLLITVDSIDDEGRIVNAICSGTPAGIINKYYLKVISNNQFEVYEDPLLQIPVSGLTIPYTGFTSSNVTNINSTNDRLTIADTSLYNVNDAVIFTGDVQTNITNIVEGQTYYIYDIANSTEFRICRNPGDSSTIVNMVTSIAVAFTMTMPGSYAFLPEPFYFNQSIVKFNNKVYVCVVSNNDNEFIFGKWELLESGDRRLNAMDRVIGYYQPTDNMPGIDLTQLFTGLTYPNSTYLGNQFDPNNQFNLDVALQDQPFYVTGINSVAVAYNGNSYIVVSNLNNYSALLTDVVGNDWDIGKLSESNLNLTDITYANTKFIITSTNSATPIFRSNDGIAWSTTGVLLPNNDPLNGARLSLNSVAYGNGRYVAVGKNIISSTDAYSWTLCYTAPSYISDRLYSVTYVNIPSFTGFVAVGKGQRFEFSSGIPEKIDTSIIMYSSDGVSWNIVPSLTTNGLYGVTSNGSNIIAVGDNGVVYTSNNGANWTGVNEAGIISVNGSTDVINVTSTIGFVDDDVVRFNNSFDEASPGPGYNVNSGTSYYVRIISPTQIQLGTAPLPAAAINLTGLGTIPYQTLMYSYPRTEALNDVLYASSQYTAVGDDGLVRTSNDGITWTTQTSGVTEDLNGLNYVSTTSTFTAVGDNNTILQSIDNGVNWTASTTFNVAPPIYDVQGEPFLSGYGPEELVPGVLSDNLNMIVTTRPGTNWEATQYAHVGYNVVSLELSPANGTQTEYSFFNEMAQVPAQIAVFFIDGTTGLSLRLYPGTDYDIDWVSEKIILYTPLAYPSNDKLIIDVYEVGNGNQLVKSNSFSDPIRLNTTTGFNEIELSCNYSDYSYNGGGVVRPGGEPIEERALYTSSLTNSIYFNSVQDFVENQPITFIGIVFGGLSLATTYYVKTISEATNSITVSLTLTGGGVAGPTLSLTDYTGSDVMYAVVQAATGLVWTTPVVYHNGTKLNFGHSALVINVDASADTITTISTSAMYVNQPIIFDNTIFANEIDPFTVYYVQDIVSSTEFRISTTISGPALNILADSSGSAMYLTNDYAITLSDNGITAKVIFTGKTDPLDSTKKIPYDDTVDYLVYSFFDDSFPIQYSYTIPETEYLVGDGTSTYTLSNYVGGVNPENSIVEVNGLRQIYTTDYTINSTNETLNFVSSPSIGDTITVVTFNDTERQYLNTQNFTGLTVANISLIYNVITIPLAVTEVTASLSTGNVITALSTAGFIAGQPIEFKGTAFGNMLTDGTVYFVSNVINGTDFTICADPADVGNPSAEFDPGNDTGLMKTYVGGTPTVRIITSSAHNLVAPVNNNEQVRLDGILGSTQLNNNLYYVHVIDANTFDIYEQPYDPTFAATNYPITEVSSYISGGYIWNPNDFTLYTTEATGTSTSLLIDVVNANNLVANTPIYFTEDGIALGSATSIPEIIAGQKYFLKYVEPIEDAGSFSPGRVYRIFFLGDTDWNAIGYVGTPIAGGTFTASGAGTGTGRANAVNMVTISETYNGNQLTVTSGLSGLTIRLAQWEQTNVDRLWVTINGYRVPSSNLRLNEVNQVSILSPIISTDDVIITSMMPSATPNEEVYLLNVNQINTNNTSVVYRANTNTRTWNTETVYDLDDTIYVDDVSRLIKTIVQNEATPVAVGGVYTIGLDADKDIITSITIYNNTTMQTVTDFEFIVENLSPLVNINSGVTTGDQLTITITEGNLIYVNGEQIKFSSANLANNTISGLQRGYNGTGEQTLIPIYSEIYSLLSVNRMTDINYNDTWNKIPGIYNITEGDPLQIADSEAAQFLRTDI